MASTHHPYHPTDSKNSMKQPYRCWAGESFDFSIMQQLGTIELLMLGTFCVTQLLLHLLMLGTWSIFWVTRHLKIFLSTRRIARHTLKLNLLVFNWEFSHLSHKSTQLGFTNDLVKPFILKVSECVHSLCLKVCHQYITSSLS